MIPTHSLPALLLALLSAAPAPAPTTEVLPKPAGEARVLVLAPPSDAFVEELSHRALDVETAGTAGLHPGLLAEDSTILRTLRKPGTDFVVLVGTSSFGKTLVIDGEVRVGDPSDLLHHGRLLLAEVRRAGARPVILVPPMGPGAPTIDRQAVDWAFHRLGREAGAVLAPVGDAFDRARRQRPELALFDAHGERWSVWGSALAAAVIEATVSGRMPVGGRAMTGGPTAAQADIDNRLFLHRVAWAAVRELAASGGYRDLPPPPFPVTPTLPHGDRLAIDDSLGSWRGPLRLYPWSATLEIDIRPRGESVEIVGRVTFAGSQPGFELRATDLEVGQRVLTFRNPSDLAGGRTRYRLVARDGRLTGVAELTTPDGGAYAIGGFELRRVDAANGLGQQ